ncbi:hypothetical protein BK120_21135 [Paenibacillus sp. FSL A5-0031]|nr:hypothetical protein BK120_21135 [Paenibacillus sp. FSL A5-0031]
MTGGFFVVTLVLKRSARSWAFWKFYLIIQLKNIITDYQRLALENEKGINLIQGYFFNCWSNGQVIIIEMKDRAACF